MLTTTFLQILLMAITALLFALFQYRIGVKQSVKNTLIYTALRFLSVFGLLILLVNPKWTEISYYEEKPSLAIAIDNSRSIEHLGYDSLVVDVVKRFRESKILQDNFELQFFKFGEDVNLLDSLGFTENQTNLSTVFTSLGDLYKNGVAPTILVTDGNQTFGRDFKYAAKDFNQPIYPVIAGDTVQYSDIRIGRVNVNRYAYVKNKFPVEVFLNYSGKTENIQSSLQIRSRNRVVHKETVRFSKESPSMVRTILLPADRVGLNTYSVSVTPLSDEKNKDNNYRNFAIEVIDQKTNVLLVSDMVHPDIGMFKKSIESNVLREVTVLNSIESAGKINDYQLVIIYQPTEQFAEVFRELEELNKNVIIVTGPQTNWGFLNDIQTTVKREITQQTEDVQAVLNASFSSFALLDIGFSEFPPLKGSFGDITFNSEVDIALFQKIGAINTSQPLIALSDLNGQRSINIFGEGIWKWRAQAYRESNSFKDFDNFIDKLIQYGASNKRKNRLELSYDSFYYGNSDIRISAQYFDKNYTFDGSAALTATVINQESKEPYKAPFLLKGNYYELDLSNLVSGEYKFTVSNVDQNLSRSGSFTIIPFEAEVQFANANVDDLRTVAQEKSGNIFTLDNIDNLVNELAKDDRYRPIQKSNEKIVPLIDRIWLLGLIALFLSLEWFLRKYHGLT